MAPVLAWITARLNALVLVLLALLVLLGLLGWKLNAARLAALARAESADERVKLAEAKQPVAIPVDTKALQKERDELHRQLGVLASAYSAELAEVHELRAVLIARGTTGPVTAHGTPLPAPTTGGQGGQGAGAGGTSSPSTPAPASRGRVLLAEGDKAEIATTVEVDQTDKRNLLVNVIASANRTDPAPLEQIIPSALVRQQTVHVDPVLVEGPTVTKTRWWLVGVGTAVGFAAGAATCRVR